MFSPKHRLGVSLLFAARSAVPTQSSPWMQVDPVAIYVSDLKTSVAFYKDVLAFTGSNAGDVCCMAVDAIVTLRRTS